MRILMASDFYPPSIGGAERQVQLLSNELTQRGHQVRVATVRQPGAPREVDEHGVRVHRIDGWVMRMAWLFNDPARRYNPPFPDPGMALGLRRLVNSYQPDLVHASGWIAYSCAAALLGSQVPLVVSVRDYGYSCAIRSMLYQGQTCSGPQPMKCLQCAEQSYGWPKSAAAVAGILVTRQFLIHKLSAAHSISGFIQMTVRRDLLREHGTPQPGGAARRASILEVVIPSFIEDRPEQAVQQRDLARLPSQPYILFVGSLRRHKGIFTLLDAYQRLDLPPPLVIVGATWADSPDFPSGVTVIPNMPHAAVMKAWERSLFGVVPSLWPEPLGGVVYEAMSRGKPVIGTAAGGIPDMIVDGQTGILFPPGDVDALEAAMRRLLADPGLCHTMGQAGRQRVDELFTARAVVPQFERLYRDLLGARSGPAPRPTLSE